MKTLIVAPSLPDLVDVPDEVAALANRVPSVLLQGTVNKGQIIGAIEREGSFEGFWFATHGNADGVMLSNGAMLSAYDIAAHANTANCEWVVLNTCESRSLVSSIQNISLVDIVATETGTIADEAAWQFARLLAIEFSKGRTMRQSVLAVAPGSTVHRYYRNERRDMTRQFPIHPAVAAINPTIDEKIDILTGLVDGDPRRGVVGLRTQNKEIIDRLLAIERRQNNADEERAELSAKLTTAYYVLIALAIGVMVGTLAIVWILGR